MNGLGSKEPWKDYLRREVGWAEEALAKFSEEDDAPHRYTDLFREKKVRATSFEGCESQEWSYDMLKEMLAKVLSRD